MDPSQPLRVAALVDLPRRADSGGHVKCWERLAEAAVDSNLPLDLTVYFSGSRPDEALGPHVRLRHLPPVFSTANLKFLPYMPDTTDLASWHGRLARELPHYDVIHTTDGFFAFAQTAAKVSRRRGIPLVTSFHTDTPKYTRIFTRQTIEKLARPWPQLQRKLIEEWQVPEKQGRRMEEKLAAHVRACAFALATRPEDNTIAETILGPGRVGQLRLGIDKKMFGPHKADRAALLHDYHIDDGKIVALFVGRADASKNIYTLIEAVERLAAEGAPLHLIIAGAGPATEEARRRLGAHVSLPGYVPPEELARLFAGVDMLTLSSEIEIRGMVGGEALVSACPVLVSEKSGIAALFHYTPGMREVKGGAESWAEALRGFIADAPGRAKMRVAALHYADHFLASWQDVMREDLFPVWEKAAGKNRRLAA